MREFGIHVDLGSEVYHQLLKMGYTEGHRLYIKGQTLVRFSIPASVFILMEGSRDTGTT